jgi:hypothetical protein
MWRRCRPDCRRCGGARFLVSNPANCASLLRDTWPDARTAQLGNQSWAGWIGITTLVPIESSARLSFHGLLMMRPKPDLLPPSGRACARRPLIVWLLTACFTGGCIASETSHENFLANLSAWDGKDIRNHLDFRRFDRTVLANGHYEYRFVRQILIKKKGLCTSIFEVDPVTFMVLRTDYAGSTEACAIPP